MKHNITKQKYNKVIDKFITYQLEPHEEKYSEEYPDSTFWVKDGEVIAEVDEKLNYFWVHHEIWYTISRMFSLEKDETQEVIRNWLEEHYKLGSLTPIASLIDFAPRLQEH